MFHRFTLLNKPNLNYGVKSGLSLLILLFGSLILGQSVLGLTASLGMFAALISGADEPKQNFWFVAIVHSIHFFVTTLLLLLLFKFHTPYLLVISFFTFLFAMYSAFGITAARLGVASLILVILTHPTDLQSGLWQTPLLYLLGSTVHLIVSRTWISIWPYRALRENLAAYYFTLAKYVDLKRELMSVEPFDNRPLLPLQQTLTTLLLEGEKLVSSIKPHSNKELSQLTELYFLGKELHELFSATAYAPQKIYPIFRSKEVEPVFTSIMQSYVKQLREVGNATLNHNSPKHIIDGKLILELRVQLFLAPNVRYELIQLANAHFTKLTARLSSLTPRFPHEIIRMPKEPWLDKLKASLSWKPTILRHAVR